MNITVKLAHLRAAHHFCAKLDEQRLALTGVLIEALPGEVRIVATNGVATVVFREPNVTDETGQCIVPVDAIEATVWLGGRPETVDIAVDPECIIGAIKHGNTSAHFYPVKDTYPDYRKAFPDGANGELAHYDLAYMALFLDAADELNVPAHSVVIHHNGRNAASVSIAGYDDFAGALMPYDWKKIKDGVAPVRDWVKD